MKTVERMVMPHAIRQFGFTLIEIMTVMLLIGLIMSMVMVSVGDGNRGKKVQGQARELYHSMHLLLEESVFVREQYGIRFDLEQGDDKVHWVYSFMVFNPEKRLWATFETDDLTSKALFEGVQLRLEIEGEEVELGLIENDAHRLFELNEDETTEAKLIEPDVYFLSSGETQNFKLIIVDNGPLNNLQRSFDDDESPKFSITGNLLGQIEFWLPGESKADDE